MAEFRRKAGNGAADNVLRWAKRRRGEAGRCTRLLARTGR
jgi:hypothetical protein